MAVWTRVQAISSYGLAKGESFHKLDRAKAEFKLTTHQNETSLVISCILPEYVLLKHVYWTSNASMKHTSCMLQPGEGFLWSDHIFAHRWFMAVMCTLWHDDDNTGPSIQFDKPISEYDIFKKTLNWLSISKPIKGSKNWNNVHTFNSLKCPYFHCKLSRNGRRFISSTLNDPSKWDSFAVGDSHYGVQTTTTRFNTEQTICSAMPLSQGSRAASESIELTLPPETFHGIYCLQNYSCERHTCQQRIHQTASHTILCCFLKSHFHLFSAYNYPAHSIIQVFLMLMQGIFNLDKRPMLHLGAFILERSLKILFVPLVS